MVSELYESLAKLNVQISKCKFVVPYTTCE